MGGWRGSAYRPILALLALFSGIALLLNIIAKLDLRLGFLAMTACLILGVRSVLRGSAASVAQQIGRETVTGVLAGISATLAYDLVKAGLAAIDPSPFDPFHAIGVFGQLLVGTSEAGPLTTLAGIAFHLLNGMAFGVAYVFLFARQAQPSMRGALATGLGWGLFLELFQLTLYPGWLDIRAYAEFGAISLLGHVVYGFMLGAISRASLLRWSRLLGPEGGTLDG